MFELLNEDERGALAKVVDELKLPEGDTLFQAGDPGDSHFVVQSENGTLHQRFGGAKDCADHFGNWRHVR